MLSQDLCRGANLVFPESANTLISLRYITRKEATGPIPKAANESAMPQLYAAIKKYKRNVGRNVTVWPVYSSIGNLERVGNVGFFCDTNIIQRTAPREYGSRSCSVHPRSTADDRGDRGNKDCGRWDRSQSVQPRSTADDIRGRSRSVHPKLRDDVRGRSHSVHPKLQDDLRHS